MKNKRSLIQEQQPDHEAIRRQNEINLQPAIQVYRMYTQLHTRAQAEQVADSLSTIEFLQKLCEKNMKLRDFAQYAAQFFRYEYYKFGQPIMNQGDYGDRFYVLLQGEVGVFIKRPAEEVAAEMEFMTQQPSDTNIGGLKKKKTMQITQTIGELVLKMQGEGSMYYNDGVPLFRRVYQFYSGQCFGEQALIHDQPRTASIIVISDEAHFISMNKQDYKLVCEKQIQEQNSTIDYFMKLFSGVSKFTVTKFIQYFRTITFPSQAILWKEGDEPKFFFLIMKGRVELFRQIPETLISIQNSKKKKKITLSQLSDNAFVGQEEILEGLPHRHHSCQAADNTLAYYMEANEFNAVKKNFPEIVKLLKDKSTLITEYMNIRQQNIVQNLKQHETDVAVSPRIAERMTVKEIFKDPGNRPDKNDIRSQKPKVLLQTEIAHQNYLYNQRKLPTDPKTKFLMVDTNMIEQIRDRVTRKIQTSAEKKDRVKTTKLEEHEILVSRIQSGLDRKKKKLTQSDTLSIKITSSEPNLLSPTFVSSSTNTIPMIQRSWNPQCRQLKAKLRKSLSRVGSRNTAATTGFTENEELIGYMAQPRRIHTGKPHHRKIYSALQSQKSNHTNYMSFI